MDGEHTCSCWNGSIGCAACTKELQAELEVMTKHANEGWALANTRTAELTSVNLQIRDLMDALQVLEAAQSVPPAFRAVARGARERTMAGTNKVSYEQFIEKRKCQCLVVGVHRTDCPEYKLKCDHGEIMVTHKCAQCGEVIEFT